MPAKCNTFREYCKQQKTLKKPIIVHGGGIVAFIAIQYMSRGVNCYAGFIYCEFGLLAKFTKLNTAHEIKYIFTVYCNQHPIPIQTIILLYREVILSH